LRPRRKGEAFCRSSAVQGNGEARESFREWKGAKQTRGEKKARFLQIEHKIRAVVKCDLADAVPLVP
jgi:hypothetical protein